MARLIGLDAPAEMHETKQRLLEAGLRLLLERGYHAIGVQEILTETGIPKGSFYHHFESKEDFALQAVDVYHTNAYELLDTILSDRRRSPLTRVRSFFETIGRSYESEGYLGCLLGGLGQELSGASEIFRLKIESCLASIAGRLAICLEEARAQGELPRTCDPIAMANLLVNAWEGAALRSRLLRSGRPLAAILDFYFSAVTPS